MALTRRITSLSANALASRVLARHARESLAEIVEKAEDLATGGWMRVGKAVALAIYVKIADAYVDLGIEWPDVQVTTEGSRIIVAVNSTTIRRAFPRNPRH